MLGVGRAHLLPAAQHVRQLMEEGANCGTGICCNHGNQNMISSQHTGSSITCSLLNPLANDLICSNKSTQFSWADGFLNFPILYTSIHSAQ